MKNLLFKFHTGLFCLVSLLSACTKDHDIPASKIDIRTLAFEPSIISTVFKIQTNALGDKPITEHGVVYTAYFRGVGNHNLEPTINDNKVLFDTDLVAGVNEFTYLKDIIAGRTFFYYRAYAILNDNSVVYANRLSHTIE